MSWLSSGLRKLGGALGVGDKTTTQTMALDPASQKYVEAMRMQAQQGANTIMGGPGFGQRPFMGGQFGMPGGNSWFTGPQTQSVGDQAAAFFNPYMSNVVDGVRGEYDHLRAQSAMGSNQQATLGG